VPALLAAGVALEQEPMHLHDAVDPLHVRRGPALPLGLTTQESMNPSIAVGGQIGNERLDRGDKPSIRQRRATSTTRGGPLPRREVRARDAQGCGHRAHRPPSGHELTRKGSFLGAVTRSTASRRISFSSVFLPNSRCSSRICCCAARNSETGTTSSPAPAAVKAPRAMRRRQVKSWLAL